MKPFIASFFSTVHIMTSRCYCVGEHTVCLILKRHLRVNLRNMYWKVPDLKDYIISNKTGDGGLRSNNNNKKGGGGTNGPLTSPVLQGTQQ